LKAVEARVSAFLRSRQRQPANSGAPKIVAKIWQLKDLFSSLKVTRQIGKSETFIERLDREHCDDEFIFPDSEVISNFQLFR
jgi:hypothetical protein